MKISTPMTIIKNKVGYAICLRKMRNKSPITHRGINTSGKAIVENAIIVIIVIVNFFIIVIV